MRCFKEFDDLMFNEEIEQLYLTDIPHIRFDSSRDDNYFTLGILFALGKQIQVDNIKDLSMKDKDLYESLAVYWHKNKCRPNLGGAVKNNVFVIGDVDSEYSDIIKGLNRNGYQLLNSQHLSRPTTAYNKCFDIANKIASSSVVGLKYRETKGVLFALGIFAGLNFIDNNREIVWLNNDRGLNDEFFGDRVVKRLINEDLSVQSSEVLSILQRRK